MSRYPNRRFLPPKERMTILSKRLLNLNNGAGDHSEEARTNQIDQLERELWHLRAEMRKEK